LHASIARKNQPTPNFKKVHLNASQFAAFELHASIAIQERTNPRQIQKVHTILAQITERSFLNFAALLQWQETSS